MGDETGDQTAPEFAQVVRRGSDTTVVVFTGLGQRVGGLPAFEFSRSLESLAVNSVLLRDPNRSWYHSPVAEFGETFAQKAAVIHDLIDSAGGRSVHFIGTSAGGFAALNYATLIDVDSVLTLGGQTAISHSRRAAFGDTRWPHLIEKVNALSGGRYLDIADAGPLRAKNGAVAIVGTQSKPDIAQALHAVRCLGATCVPFAVTGGSHEVAPDLKSESKLFPLLEAQFVDGGITWQRLEALNQLGGEYQFLSL
ncbi:alpha/beta fold hydrolase [Microbacterium indicum]|uniref:alpha/beta fold hydrolase n=1 Tax=Microbacterium indicum TaxID=358100 RepID=UPI00048AB435|nr:alpha/beta hydrolase [Microbacterium indicum]